MSHFLIVEEDELLRDALGAQLTQAGHSVTPASDGERALALLESSRFDGVLLDLAALAREVADCGRDRPAPRRQRHGGSATAQAVQPHGLRVRLSLMLAPREAA